MSRSLGAKARHKAANKNYGYEADGRKMFENGLPCPRNPGYHGKEYAMWRGWMRAAAAARTANKK